MNDIPLVSVIIGAYNCAHYIVGALESVFNQTYTNLEVIVVDDASTDETLDVLRHYKDRIIIVERENNSATCELPRYQGVKVAKGLYCAFLDADDRWASCKIERQVAALERHPEMVLCHTYAEVINEHDHVTAIRHKGRLPASGSCAKALLNHCFITISSVMVRRNAWLEAMSENELSHFGMDWDFFLSLARTNQFCLIDEPLTQYRKAAGAVSYRKWRRRPRNVFSMERIRRNGLWRDVVTLKEYKRILYQAYADNAEYYCYSNSPWRALYFCLRGVRYSPANLLLYKYALKGLFRMIHEHGR